MEKIFMNPHTYFIDTSDSNLLLASWKGNQTITMEMPPGQRISQSFHSLLKTLLQKEGRPQRIAVGNGPGMFTGTRLGVMAATTLAYAWNIPLFCFCSLKKYMPDTPGPFTAISYADKEHAFCLDGELHENGEVRWDPTPIKRSLSELERTSPILTGHHPLIKKTLLSPKLAPLAAGIDASSPVDPFQCEIQYLYHL